MKSMIEIVDGWLGERYQIALATVVKTWGSSPRGVGAMMIIRESGEFVGSVSGGCVEGAVIEEAFKVIKYKQPSLMHFGVANETAWEVGLACGGEIDIYLEPLSTDHAELYHMMKTTLGDQKSFILARVIRGASDKVGQYFFRSETSETLHRMDNSLLELVSKESDSFLKEGGSHLKEFRLDHEPIEIFFAYHGPSPKLIIVGGVHIAVSLAKLAKIVGYRVIIVDPRTAFSSEERFPEVDGLVHEWPDRALLEIGMDRSTAIAVLTHDPKFDDPALQVALPSGAFYVGALGSRTTQEKRRQRLRDSGLSEEHLERLRGPIGLNLGGHSPEEIALSIMAEVVAVRTHSHLVQHV
jgi:xanthine dehydrogenase accessory factor